MIIFEIKYYVKKNVIFKDNYHYAILGNKSNEGEN